MNGTWLRGSGRMRKWLAGALVWAAALGGPLLAQTPSPSAGPAGLPAAPAASPTAVPPASPSDGVVVQTGCSSCGGALSGPSGLPGGCSGCGSGCCTGTCVPGREPCDCCYDAKTCVGRLLGGIYECICCPDPCYEPRWNALADAAFWADAPRPVTQMKLRFDDFWHYPFPDKAEYLWPRADGNGKGPKHLDRVAGGTVSYRDLAMINEVAIGRFGTWVSLPYRQVSPEDYPGASGFADMTIGTKSLLLDCELLQFTFGFNTIVPTGNFTKGLGTGHVSLEPDLLFALKLAPVTYLQGDLAYRFPLGGDQTYQGPVFHYHFSLNHLLCNCGKDIKLIGVAELNGYEIMGGAYTAGIDPANNPIVLSAKTIGSIVSIGPGIRLVICDRIDFGVGSAFNLTKDSMGDEAVRAEFRWRF